MTDVEGNIRQSAAPANPYSASPSSSVLPRYDPFNMLKRMVYMGISGYILQHFNFYRVILQSPHIRHEWFKIGLAATVGEFVFDTRGGWRLDCHGCASKSWFPIFFCGHCSPIINTVHATTYLIALLGVKAYVEIFEGKLNKKTVNYENFRQSTHAAIALFLASSLAYHIALWPHYRWNSIIVLSVAFFGVILQFLLLVPSWVQNIVGFVGLTFFLQEYK